MSETFDPTKHLRQLRGKGGTADYLDVKWRLVWLRTEHPDAITEVEHVEITADIAIFKAQVMIPGMGRATDYGSETPRDFGDYIEKAATKALGRALAQLGYGTQFVGFELDENTRIVDSPVQRDDDGNAASKPAPPRQQPQPQPRPTPASTGTNVTPPQYVSVPCPECPNKSVCRSEGYCERDIGDYNNRRRAAEQTAAPAPGTGTPAPASERFGPGIEPGDMETIMRDAATLHQTGKPYAAVVATLQAHRADMDAEQVKRVKVFLKAITPTKPAPGAAPAQPHPGYAG